MRLKTFFLSTLVLSVVLLPTAFVSAAEPVELLDISASVQPSEIQPVVVATVISPEMTELKNLNAKEQDPETGAFMKFILRLKIRQLETQLNIKKALK